MLEPNFEKADGLGIYVQIVYQILHWARVDTYLFIGKFNAVTVKGQIIKKGLFGVLEFSQKNKRTNSS